MSNGEPRAVTKNVFTLSDGDIRVWIDQEAIHMVACDPQYRDPVELTATMARQLAAALEKMADRLDED